MQDKLLYDVINFFGIANQIDIAIEEMSELIQALCKYKRSFSNLDNLAEEIADVEICMRQINIMFEGISPEIASYKKQKLERLKQEIQTQKTHK